ncbi:MAG: hypothetical protein E6J34_16385 [Chloroflexi bacterium]|nr:MAG: hypothetical protein E6J34_16385 [Chloroflexota bacterium]
MCNENTCDRAVAVRNEHERLHTAMTQRVTQGERSHGWLCVASMMGVAYRCGASRGAMDGVGLQCASQRRSGLPMAGQRSCCHLASITVSTVESVTTTGD